MYKVILDSNSYKNNYASYSSLVGIYNLKFVTLSNEIYLNNGDSYDEVLTNLGILTPVSLSSTSTFYQSVINNLNTL